jgi:hypothetical protein
MPFGTTTTEQIAFADWANARGGDAKLYNGAFISGPPARWSYTTVNESISRAERDAPRYLNSLTVREGDTVEFDGDTFRIVPDDASGKGDATPVSGGVRGAIPGREEAQR